MLIIEFNWPPSWCLDAGKTGGGSTNIAVVRGSEGHVGELFSNSTESGKAHREIEKFRFVPYLWY